MVRFTRLPRIGHGVTYGPLSPSGSATSPPAGTTAAATTAPAATTAAGSATTGTTAAPTTAASGGITPIPMPAADKYKGQKLAMISRQEYFKDTETTVDAQLQGIA